MKLVFEEVIKWIETTENNWWIYVFILPVVAAIGALLFYVLLLPLRQQKERKISNLPHGQAIELSEIGHISYSNIGITVDFSRNDKETIRRALVQGGKTANYYLIHIVETAGASYYGEGVMDYETRSDRQNVEKYKLSLERLGYRAQVLMGYGKASASIAELAKKHRFDLLVMGAHGHRGISDIVYGTTVESVRHKVNIPILIVR